MKAFAWWFFGFASCVMLVFAALGPAYLIPLAGCKP